MTPLCASCGTGLYGEAVERGFCLHHDQGDEWAAANRIFCDWLHRHVEPPPLAHPMNLLDELAWVA